MDGKVVKIHPKSVLFKDSDVTAPFSVYFQRLKSSSDFIHDLSMIQTLPLIFFGDGIEQQTTKNGVNVLCINEMFRIRCLNGTADLLLDIKNRFNSFLEYRVSNPRFVKWNCDDGGVEILR